MMYGRSVRKALDTFDLDHSKWPELAADRLAWRVVAGDAAQWEAAVRLPRAAFDPRRPAHRAHTAQATDGGHHNAAIQDSLQQLAATTRLGMEKRKRRKRSTP